MSVSATKKPSRRRFIFGGLGLSGALIVGWGIMPPRQRLDPSKPLPVKDGAVALNGWVTIAPDGSVGVVVPRAEMGQGVYTALPMLVAEELDVPLSMVRLHAAPVDKIYGNIAMLQDNVPIHPDDQGRVKAGATWMLGKVARELGLVFTGGSSSVKDAWSSMRQAGATARAMLVAAAAAEWGVPPETCTTEGGVVVHASGKRLEYAKLAAKAVTMRIGAVKLKDPKDFKLIGTPVARRDSPAKTNGTAMFGIDVRQPGMLVAVVKMSPVVGGSVGAVDDKAARAVAGFVRTVDFSAALRGKTGAGAGVAVVGKGYWPARQAASALNISWHEGAHAQLNSAELMKDLGKQLEQDRGFTYHKVGDVEAAKPGKTLKAEYSAPYLAHATMEPINCTAQVKDGKVQLWVPTQVASAAVDMAAKVAGVSADQVSIEVTLLGGGFGRRLEVDMVAQAVAVAKACEGLPVQLIWSREQDMTHDVYRPAALARFEGGLDTAGNLISWDNRSAGESVAHQFNPRVLGLPGAGPDRAAAEGEFDMQYEIAHQKISHLIVDSVLPVGYWRSVGHSHNAFFKESFIEEMAHAAGRDSVIFRRGLLKNHPRQLAVLDAVVARAGLPGEGRAHGVALHQSFGTICAQVAEVSVANGAIEVHKVYCAVDCGIAVNPNIIAQQVESAVIFGLSAALMGEITVKAGKVEQSNFHDYPVLRMEQAPEVITVIVPSALPPEGMGEPALPPVAPAVANAVFKLTGKRLRSLPLRLS